MVNWGRIWLPGQVKRPISCVKASVMLRDSAG